MTRRNKVHGRIEATLAKLLGNWLDQTPEPRGEIVRGEAGFRIRQNPETLVGIDVAYASPELIAADDPSRPYYDGPPVLSVEILSPSETHGAMVEKVRAYLEVGVVVWEVDPDFQTIRIHRPGVAPVLLNIEQELIADPCLPAFQVAVARVFE